MDQIKDIVDKDLFNWIKKIRRKIHQWPEIAFEEYKTAKLISSSLKEIGIEHKTGIAKTGVLGRLITDKNAPTVAIRADMDALNISENTGLAFSSKVQGVMHACGHDGHVAILLGAAAILKKRPPEGNVIFVFQPAEEGSGGAKPMIEEGVLEGVDVIFGGHIERKYQAGEIAIKKEIHTSFTDSFEIKITGRGGHAARPHEAIDSVIIASQLVMYLQTIISREVDPLHPSVISIGVMEAGTVYNAIAENASLKGTIRTTETSVRSHIIKKIKNITSSLASLHGANIKVRFNPGYPPIINRYRECEIACQVAENLLGKDRVISIPYPSLGGEDFSYFLQEIPGCFIRLGAAKRGHKEIASHSSQFDFNEEVLRIGAAYFSELARFSINKIKTNI